MNKKLMMDTLIKQFITRISYIADPKVQMKVISKFKESIESLNDEDFKNLYQGNINK